MKLVHLVVPVATFAIGGFAGYLMKGETPAAEKPKAADVRTPRKTMADRSDAMTISVLRNRIRELEGRIAAQGKGDRSAEPVAEAAREGERAGRGPRGPRDFRAEMERMRTEEPERFAEMQKRREEWNARQRERSESRNAFFASVDTSRMSAEDRATHENFRRLMARQEELRASMAAGDSATDEERNAARQELHAIREQMGALNGRERDVLLRQTASALGLSGADAKDAVDTIKTIYETTASQGGAGHGFRGGPGRGMGRGR